MAPFRIVANPNGPDSITVDGQNITGHTAAAEVIVADGQATRVILHLDRPGIIEGDGIIETVTAGTVAPQTILDLDPDQVRDMVAERCTSLADDIYAATLAVVAELVA